MKVKDDFIFAKIDKLGRVTMYVDDQGQHPYVNSQIYDGVCEAMCDAEPDTIEMICFEDVSK